MTHLEQMNQRMHILISTQKNSAVRSLDDNLAAVLQDGLIEMDGSILLARFKNSAKQITIANCHDETGYECVLNHLHVGDYIRASIAEELGQGMLFMAQLAHPLEEKYPEATFQLILTCSDSECTVRFHKVRPNQNWIADLEGYKDEAIFLLKISGADGPAEKAVS